MKESKKHNAQAPADSQQDESTSTALAAQDHNTALATIDLEADAAEFQTNYDRSDLAMPFLRVLQSNSPEVERGGPKSIDGALAGMFFDSARRELVGDGSKKPLIVIPIHYRFTYVEFVPREKGGGFVADHGPVKGAELYKTCHKDDKGKDTLPNGNHLIPTMQFLVFYLDEAGQSHTALFLLTSTQLKKGRAWNTLIDGLRVNLKGKLVKPPMFYQSYLVSTQSEKNEKGSWQGLKIVQGTPTVDLPNGGDLYVAARELRKSIDAGEIKLENQVDQQGQNEEAGGASDGADSGEERTPF
jgi:hypothetical protein